MSEASTDTRVGRLEGITGQIDKRLARIEYLVIAQLLAIFAVIIKLFLTG